MVSTDWIHNLLHVHDTFKVAATTGYVHEIVLSDFSMQLHCEEQLKVK